MEVNTLMKTMAEKAGLDNFHLTNYSAQTRIIQTKQSCARSFCENKLVRKYSTSAPSMKNYIYIYIYIYIYSLIINFFMATQPANEVRLLVVLLAVFTDTLLPRLVHFVG